jgi:cellulose synthase/poly-beta-1,6-N-acetylglucosamine synthase-like glycosyltransferase
MLRKPLALETKKTNEIGVLKWILLYYPIRYIACAALFAYIGLSNIQFIQAVQIQTLSKMLEFVHISTFQIGGFFYVGNIASASEIVMPFYTEILFLIFFPTLAVTARISLKRRLKFLGCGVLCFFAFLLTQYLAIVFMNMLGILTAAGFMHTSVFLTIISAGLLIELALFSNIIMPNKFRIRPLIKRHYIREYAYLAITLTCSFILMYLLLNFLQLDTDAPIVAYALLEFNMVTIMTFGYFLSILPYKVKTSFRLRQSEKSEENQERYTIFSSMATHPYVSFIVIAYNEENFIKRCIESIDRATSTYAGKAEIIIVDDGSADRTLANARDSVRKLKHCRGKVFSIPNSGKGFALRYALERTSGEILFRIDADSVLGENSLGPVINHFLDPEVGSVSGMLFPLQARSIWQKTVALMFIYYIAIVKRAQELADSIIVQAGAFCVFRKDALIKSGGWASDQFGEDGEITNRMARFGYKAQLELESRVYTDFPKTLVELIHQRSRWNVAFYHSRGRNLDLAREFKNPRSIVFLTNLISHGSGFAHSLIWGYLIASFIALNFSLLDLPSFLGITKFAMIQLLIYSGQISVLVYFLAKQRKVGYIKYFPVLRLLGFIFSTVVRTQATEVLLHWSSNCNSYDDRSFEALRREVRRSIDPST